MKHMIRRLNRRTLILVVLIAMIAIAASTGIAFAISGIPAEDGTIYGCYTDHQNSLERQGSLRVVTGPGKCKSGEVSISWNQTGPQGPAGPQGDTGIPALSGNIQSSGSAGGSGGSPFTLDCPEGYVLVGIWGRAGSSIDRVQGACQKIGSDLIVIRGFVGATLTGTIQTTATAGGWGGSPYQLSCPVGYVVTGLTGRVGNGGAGYVDQMQVQCSALAGTGSASTGTVGSVFPGSVTYDIACPGDSVGTGVSGRAGNVIDQISLRCQ